MNCEDNRIPEDKTFETYHEPQQMDKSKWIQLPRNVILGHDALLQLPEIIADLGVPGSILLLSGETTMQVVGRKIIDLLKTRRIQTAFVGRITYAEIERIEGIARDSGVSLIIAAGGGRVIDTAKVVSCHVEIPFVSVPTSASHDGLTSPRASVSTENGKVSIAAAPPLAIVADTGIIATAPHRLLASGYADTIANYTAILDWELSSRLTGESVSEYASTLSKITAEILVKNADLVRRYDENAVWMVVKALFSSGIAMSIAGSSRPASGGEHKFAHMLERLAPGVALHGEACGVGTILGMYLHGGDWRGIRSSLKCVGAPTTPAELGISDETAVEAVLRAKEIRPERFTIFDTGVTEDAARACVMALYEV